MAPVKVAKPIKGEKKLTSATQALTMIGIFSVLMMATPIVLFLASNRGYLDGIYHYTVGIPTPERRGVLGALVAVLGVNCVVGAFICCAFQEVNADLPMPAKPTKQD